MRHLTGPWLGRTNRYISSNLQSPSCYRAPSSLPTARLPLLRLSARTMANAAIIDGTALAKYTLLSLQNASDLTLLPQISPRGCRCQD